MASMTSVRAYHLSVVFLLRFISKFTAVVLLNVQSFWEPVRTLINSSIDAGFIRPENANLVVFVDGPADHSTHEAFDWGSAALEALDGWKRGHNQPLFNWAQKAGREEYGQT